MTWKEGRQSPDTALMRFASRRFFSSADFLDIGSGEGANARELRQRGHLVLTIDKARHCLADFYADIRDMPEAPWSKVFDLIYDVNTLCHVKDPPFEKIKNWLKPEGIFFSVWPTNWAPKYIEEGKDFTDKKSEFDLRQSLQPFFSEIRIYWRSEPDFKGNQLESWIVEARP